MVHLFGLHCSGVLSFPLQEIACQLPSEYGQGLRERKIRILRLREQVKAADEDLKYALNAAFKNWLKDSGNIDQLQHLNELELLQAEAGSDKENVLPAGDNPRSQTV